MDTRLTENTEDPQIAETPEDVAILYSWANLHGAKYRDFSASRREYRAQVRHRAAENLRQAELRAQGEAEQAAAEAERVGREAERAAESTRGFEASYVREQSLREAEEAARRASAERVEAARRAEAAALAEAIARREEREIAEAHASAQRQAARWADSEVRRRSLAGPQPMPVAPGATNDPYVHAQGSGPEIDLYTQNTQLEYTQPARFRGDEYGSQVLSEREAVRLAESGMRRRPQGYRPDEASGIRPAFRPEAAPEQALPGARGRSEGHWTETRNPASGVAAPHPVHLGDFDPGEFRTVSADFSSARQASSGSQVANATPESQPAWLSAPSEQAQGSRPSAGPSPGASGASGADTLQDSRERVAARWFALKGVFEPGQEPLEQASAEPRQNDTQTPVLAVLSLAGGVGKTSLVATLGRALSSVGEQVLLADTTSHGLLPFYFGASELLAGVVRTFSPPSGSVDAPIYLVSYDVNSRGGSPEALADEIGRASTGTHRLVLDLGASSSSLIRVFSDLSPIVLVPVAPDMNSVISLQAVEGLFKGMADTSGRPIQPFYVLNQFDASLPLHLDVREVLRRQLGSRLLPYTIRRSPAVSEALAEGMTVVDYAAATPIAEDYLNIANWLRSVSAPATQGIRNIRWSER